MRFICLFREVIAQSLSKVVDICNPWGNLSFCNDPRTSSKRVKIFIHPTKSGDFANKSWHTHHHVISSRQRARAHKATCNHTQQKLISLNRSFPNVRRVLLRISKTRNRREWSSQFFSLRAGRSKKPFPDGTHIAIKAESKDLLESAAVVLSVCVCTLVPKIASSLARVWLMAASRAICLVSAAGARAVSTAGVKLITFHSQSVQNYRLCDLDGPCLSGARCAPLPWYTSGWPCA